MFWFVMSCAIVLAILALKTDDKILPNIVKNIPTPKTIKPIVKSRVLTSGITNPTIVAAIPMNIIKLPNATASEPPTLLLRCLLPLLPIATPTPTPTPTAAAVPITRLLLLLAALLGTFGGLGALGAGALGALGALGRNPPPGLLPLIKSSSCFLT